MKSRKFSALNSFIFFNAATVGGLHAINRSIQKNAVTSNLLKEDAGKYFHWKYGDVFYRVSGRGDTPLVLLHDLTEYSCSYEWHAVTGLLGESFRIYTIDLPGCGRSDKNAIEYTNFFYVSFLSAFISSVVGKPAVLAGSHFSSSLSLMTSIYRPDLVSRVIMINPPLPEQLAKVPSNRDVVRRVLLFTPVLGECLYNMLTSKRKIARNLKEHVFFNSLLVNSKMETVFYESAHKGKGSGRFLRSSIDGGLMNWNIERALKVSKSEISIIFGLYWPNYEKSRTAYLKRKKGIRICAVSASGTLPHMENPRAFCNAVL